MSMHLATNQGHTEVKHCSLTKSRSVIFLQDLQIVSLTVHSFNRDIFEFEHDPEAAVDADLPLAHRVVGVLVRVVLQGQVTTPLTQIRLATAIL